MLPNLRVIMTTISVKLAGCAFHCQLVAKKSNNLVTLLVYWILCSTDSGTEVFSSQLQKAILSPEEIPDGADVKPPFNAYSPPGNITTGKVYYVNYGSEQDFKWLKDNNIDVNGSVVIARYGKLFRANKVRRHTSHRTL